MGKVAKGVKKINYTVLYGSYCYIIIENFSEKFSPCTFIREKQQKERSSTRANKIEKLILKPSAYRHAGALILRG